MFIFQEVLEDKYETAWIKGLHAEDSMKNEAKEPKPVCCWLPLASLKLKHLQQTARGVECAKHNTMCRSTQSMMLKIPRLRTAPVTTLGR